MKVISPSDEGIYTDFLLQEQPAQLRSVFSTFHPKRVIRRLQWPPLVFITQRFAGHLATLAVLCRVGDVLSPPEFPHIAPDGNVCLYLEDGADPAEAFWNSAIESKWWHAVPQLEVRPRFGIRYLDEIDWVCNFTGTGPQTWVVRDLR